tara:strand:- start:1128 stop:1475 length:348 start_codon:yes stop_codon:yes gene_type:complete
MAYIKKDMHVFFANEGFAITAVIDKVAFRKYWGKGKDKDGNMVRKRKSMPFACCRVLISSDPEVNIGEEFIIAGYKLRAVVIRNEKMLTFDRDYVAEYAKELGNEWVRRIINDKK